jgi:hypothetical protein
LEHGDLLRDELERIAVGSRDERGAALVLLPHRGRCEEVVGLVAGLFRVRETCGRDERRQEVELFEELAVEHAARLVEVQRLVSVRRYVERVPGNENRPRLLVLPEPEQHVCEADQRVRRATVRPPHRLRQRVIRPMGEGVAVQYE